MLLLCGTGNFLINNRNLNIYQSARASSWCETVHTSGGHVVGMPLHYSAC